MKDYLTIMQKRIIDILDHTLSGDEGIFTTSGDVYVDELFFGGISTDSDIHERALTIIDRSWFKREVLKKSYYPVDERTLVYNADKYAEEDDGGVTEFDDIFDVFDLVDNGNYSKARDILIEALYYYNAYNIVRKYLERKYPEATKATKKNESAWKNNNMLRELESLSRHQKRIRY